MKVLILTATIGHGHNAVAKSLQKQFDQMEIPCKTMDMYETVSPALKSIVSYGYLLSIQSVVHARSIGVKYYNAMEKAYKPSKSNGLSVLPTKTIAKELKKEFDDFSPDIIICTQVYCAHALNLMKHLMWITCPVIGVITDFTVQAHWGGTTELDYIVVPTDKLKYQLEQKGIAMDRVISTGIPINPTFAETVDKQTARAALGLDPLLPTLFIMGGSMGYGNLDKTIKNLDGLDVDFQGIVVCGNNKSMYEKLSHIKTTKNFHIIGYCNVIPLLMDASDVMITKPGGISTSECLAKKLPMIPANAIPGMEDHNGEFLANHGIAIMTSKNYPMEEAVYSLLADPQLCAQLTHNMAPYSHPNATRDLCEFVRDLTEKL